MIRAVLDTNVVVSALLFSGQTSRLVPLWQTKKFVPLLCKEMMDEYIRVLAYPKFRLTPKEVAVLLERQLIAFSHPVSVKNVVPIIREDPIDDIFLACALAGRAQFIVSGDKHLLTLKRYSQCRILSVDKFFEIVA